MSSYRGSGPREKIKTIICLQTWDEYIMVKYIGGPCASHIITALFCIWLKLTLADVSQEIGVLTGSEGKINYYNVSDTDLDLEIYGRPKPYKNLLNTSTDFVRVVDYHWDKKLVFGRTNDGTIYRTSFDAQPAQAVLKADGDFRSLAVDWVHDRILTPTRNGTLWKGGDNGTAIVSTDLDGGDLTVLFIRPVFGSMRRMSVDPYEGKIFWIYKILLEKHVESCNLDGTEFKSIIKSMNIIELSLDYPTRKVFLVDKENSLYSMDYTGENLRNHWKMTLKPNGFDVLDGIAYWFNINIIGRFIFYKSDTNQSKRPQRMFSMDEKTVYYIQIVHPSVQEKPCSSGRWTYYICVTTTEQSVTSTTESVKPSVTVTDSEEPPTTLMPLTTRQSTPSPNDTQRGHDNAKYHRTHSSITDHIVVFNALVSVVLLMLVVFVIRKYNNQRHNELSVANVAYNPSGVDNLYKP